MSLIDESSSQGDEVDFKALKASNLCLAERLKLEHYDCTECSAAIKGEQISFALGFLVSRLCVRGIRYDRNASFGAELSGLPDYPEFTRALNARSIMSNTIPLMTFPEGFPSCTWHPDIPSPETYRELVRRYPQMSY
ncbi:hypothetical protein GX50_05667 [[Emmonsia] crescens]|uniref:Uncharacterized protein n=1 Tax=[Emmonsia] crescens TaxID=73230 RepID=A0A2B7Z5B6_9EURO|nr:hypothetical protein GX50_05667 [Emmonsia crescens]